jgi:hypothetical protein
MVVTFLDGLRQLMHRVKMTDSSNRGRVAKESGGWNILGSQNVLVDVCRWMKEENG